jgi:hypothetical protein
MGFAATVALLALGDLGVGAPMRHWTKLVIQRLMFRHSIITHIGMGVTVDECTHVTRPKGKLTKLRWRFHAKVTLASKRRHRLSDAASAFGGFLVRTICYQNSQRVEQYRHWERIGPLYGLREGHVRQQGRQYTANNLKNRL